VGTSLDGGASTAATGSRGMQTSVESGAEAMEDGVVSTGGIKGHAGVTYTLAQSAR